MKRVYTVRSSGSAGLPGRKTVTHSGPTPSTALLMGKQREALSASLQWRVSFAIFKLSGWLFFVCKRNQAVPEYENYHIISLQILCLEWF